MCWTRPISLGAPLVGSRLPGTSLGQPNIHITPLVLNRSRGGIMLVSQPLVVHNCHAVSRGFSPILLVRRCPRGSAPTGGWDMTHRGGGTAATVSSKLCLDSWEERVLDPWVLATVSMGNRIQFRRPPIPFSGARMTTVRDPVRSKF